MEQTLQEFLKRELKRRNMSARELARRLGEHQARTSRVLNGQTARPDWDYLEKLARELSISLELLVALVSPDLAGRASVSPLARLIAQRFDELPEDLKARVADAILSMNTERPDDDLPLLREIRQITEK